MWGVMGIHLLYLLSLHYHSGFKPCFTAVGNVLNRAGVTEPFFYQTAGTTSSTQEKQQEGKDMKAEIVQRNQGHMRTGCLKGTRAGHKAPLWDMEKKVVRM